MKLIDKDALVAEIDKLVDKGKYHEEYDCAYRDGNNGALYALKEKVHTLEVKEVDDELQGIEKEVAEDNVNAIDRKRIPIVLKGEIKAKFKNEFNTLWQTVGGIQFANVAKHIIERLCLHFAAWGVCNLKGYCSISSEEKHKMDIKVKEVDLKEEIDKIWKPRFSLGWDDKSLLSISYKGFEAVAKHFFELGLQASNPLTWEDMMTIHKCCKDAMNCNLYAWETAEGQQKIYEDVLKRFKAQKGE